MGPGLFAYFAGWGPIALPGPRGLGFLTVYILAPVAGAFVGAHLYDLVLRRSATPAEQDEASGLAQGQVDHYSETANMATAKVKVILVGGFLGAGKTTLVAQAAERLARQGKRVGLVANDQAADLVDTELFKETGAQVEEVAGGCFCCRFPDMIAALDRLAGQGRRRRADRRAGRQLYRPVGHRDAAAEEAARAAVRRGAVFRAGGRQPGAGARSAAESRRPGRIGPLSRQCPLHL